MTKPLTLDGYVRVSKVGGREGEGFISPDVQAESIQKWADAHGHAITLHDAELDVSGGTMRRPIFDQVMQRIRSGESDGIVVYKVDRFARSLLGALTTLEEIAREGGTFASVSDNVDMTTAQGRAFLHMQLVFAQLFREQIGEQFKVAEVKAVGRGVHLTIPYGYRRGEGDGKGKPHPRGGRRGAGLVPDEPAASIVRRIFAERKQGRGLSAIADGLNADGIPSPRGGQWTRQTVRALVRVRTYLGEARKGDDNVNNAAHEPLVDAATWSAAQPSGHAKALRGDGTVLSGLIRCAGCGYVMGSQKTANGRRYHCNRNHAKGRCPSPTTAPADAIEELVETLFLNRHTPTTKLAELDPVEAAARNLVEAREAEFARWRDDADMRVLIGEDDYRTGLAARKVALDEAITAHERASRKATARALTVNAGEYLALPMLERRSWLQRALERVEVRRAVSTHQPLVERVELVWAD